MVEFVPQLQHEQLARRLRCVDVFVIPSFQEGLCISALEAMASGCPVVTTRCGGPEEFVIDGDTGRVVDFEPNDMASAIMELVSDRVLRKSIALRARAYIEQRYSPAMAKQVFWNNFDATFSQASPIADTAVGNR